MFSIKIDKINTFRSLEQFPELKGLIRKSPKLRTEHFWIIRYNL